ATHQYWDSQKCPGGQSITYGYEGPPHPFPIHVPKPKRSWQKAWDEAKTSFSVRAYMRVD
ncbi:hypothetical protein PISMIDRAFT_654692, partial [Pisolithus microcarpus 441]